MLIEKKVDSLQASVDVRFEEVTGALLEQRRYTEFAFDQLNTRIGQLEEKMDSGFAAVDSCFTQLEEKMDSRFAQGGFPFRPVDSHFARLERKLDQLIDRA